MWLLRSVATVRADAVAWIAFVLHRLMIGILLARALPELTEHEFLARALPERAEHEYPLWASLDM